MALKWGIVSTGKISNDFTKAILSCNADEHKIIAVAAQDQKRAQDFASNYSISKAYGSYEQLARDEEIDVVYIGNINTQHFDTAKLMIQNGKHVLCEKPLTVNENQTCQLIEYARSKNRFLMEAVWSRCFPLYEQLRKILDEGQIGDIHSVIVTFGKSLNHVERMNSKELGGGTILDLGIYALQFQQFVYKNAVPMAVYADGHLNKCGTDESASAIIKYSNGATALLSTHAVVELPNEAIVVGTKGTITIPSFWCPTKMFTPAGEKTYELPSSKYAARPSGMMYEVEEVRRCIRAGLLESSKITHAESLQLARLMDTLRRQVGVVFDADLNC